MDLYNWWIETEDHYIYVVGERRNGRLWETSEVVSIQTMPDHYRVHTENSVYKLFW
jgi:hypothetical protein